MNARGLALREVYWQSRQGFDDGVEARMREVRDRISLLSYRRVDSMQRGTKAAAGPGLEHVADVADVSAGTGESLALSLWQKVQAVTGQARLTSSIALRVTSVKALIHS